MLVVDKMTAACTNQNQLAVVRISGEGAAVNMSTNNYGNQRRNLPGPRHPSNPRRRQIRTSPLLQVDERGRDRYLFYVDWVVNGQEGEQSCWEVEQALHLVGEDGRGEGREMMDAVDEMNEIGEDEQEASTNCVSKFFANVRGCI